MGNSTYFEDWEIVPFLKPLWLRANGTIAFIPGSTIIGAFDWLKGERYKSL